MFYSIRKFYILIKKKIKSFRKKKGALDRFNIWLIGVVFYIVTLAIVLQSMNLWQNPGENAFQILGVAFCVFIFLLISAFYLYRYNAPVIKHPRKLLVFCLINLSALLASYGILYSTISDHAIPAVLTGILLASLIEGHGALTCIIILGGLLGFMSNFSMNIVFTFVITGGIASLTAPFINKRRDLFKIGLIAGLMGAVFIISWGWIQGWNIENISIQSLYVMGSALISAFLALEILPFLENLFGKLTDVKLLELSHLTHPLLVKLREKAPGSYQSSLMVANLAENAAEKVHANPLLAKVGAYYHDIGKIKNPSYFVENMGMKTKSKHEKVNPALSSLILTSHVKEGLQLAKKYKLPKQIRDIINQHHGTTFTSFFYQEALKKDSNNTVNEESFRYSGPKPQSREAAIVMLADTMEAASRTLEDASPARIRKLVEKLTNEKLMGGQLDESQLNFNDLNTIQQSFIQTLTGTFHGRIKYPSADQENKLNNNQNENKHSTTRKKRS